MDIGRRAGIPKQAAVTVAERQSGDLVSLPVELSHKGIVDSTDRLGLYLVCGGQRGKVDVICQAVILAPLYRLPAGRARTVGGNVLHVRKRYPLGGAADIHPRLGVGILRTGSRVKYIAERRRNTVRQAPLRLDLIIRHRRDGKDVLLFRREHIGEVGRRILPGEGKAPVERIGLIGTCTLHRIQINAVIPGKVLPAIPPGHAALPADIGHSLHTVIGILERRHFVLRLGQRDVGGLPVCLHRRRSVVDALRERGEVGRAVIAVPRHAGNILCPLQHEVVVAEVVVCRKADHKRRAGSISVAQRLPQLLLCVAVVLHAAVKRGVHLFDIVVELG